MNQRSKVLNELNKYVQNAKKWELPALRVQCVEMINMIDRRLYGKPQPILKLKWWQKIFKRRKKDGQVCGPKKNSQRR